MGELVRLRPNAPDARPLTERMRALCGTLERPGDARQLDLLNQMQATLDALYELEYKRRMENG